MEQWYSYVGGQQYGPVPRETLQQWLREGRVTGGDYVWTPGMPDWATLLGFPSWNEPPKPSNTPRRIVGQLFA